MSAGALLRGFVVAGIERGGNECCVLTRMSLMLRQGAAVASLKAGDSDLDKDFRGQEGWSDHWIPSVKVLSSASYDLIVAVYMCPNDGRCLSKVQVK
jgi:hypothetical protein